MGGIGRCCCSCECLPIEDLPTVTISGYTGGGWSGSCCYEQTFTPNATPSWSKGCSSSLYEGSVVQQCTTEHYRQTSGNYRGFEYGPLGGDCSGVPDDYCCNGGFVKIATTQSTATYTDNAFMAVWRRAKSIIVRISQEQVDCEVVEGQSSGCKIVIRSRYVYEYETAIYQNGLTSGSQTVTINSTDCFEVNTDYVRTVTAYSPITCSDVPANPPAFSSVANLCRNSGEFGFDRVRYYDAMPSGSIQFTNAEVPGCKASSCNYEPYNYASSVCVNSPSSPSTLTGCFFNEPCYCTDEPFSINPAQSFEATNCFNNGLGPLFNVTDIQGCFADPCIPAVSCTTTLTACATDDFECPDAFSINCLDFDINPENEATCFRPGVGFPFGEFIACGCSASISGGGSVEPPYYDVSDCFVGNCNEACCTLFDDCPCCLPDGRCVPNYVGRYYQTITAHTRTQSCSGLSSKSVCTGAPSWTINLA